MLAGGAGWIEARRGRVPGRLVLDVFGGMVLAAAAIAVLAFVVY